VCVCVCVCVQPTESDVALINVRHTPHCRANVVEAIHITAPVKKFTVAINLHIPVHFSRSSSFGI
jgi:hypothetical protein